MQTDIRIPDGYDEMLIVYFKDEEAKVTSYFAGPTHKGRSIHPKKMAEEAIKHLQKGLDNGNQNNDR